MKSGQLAELSKRSLRFFSSLTEKKEKTYYSDWRKKWVELNEDERQKIKQQVVSFPHHPSFSLLLDAKAQTATSIFQTIESVAGQIYPNWFLWIGNFDLLDEKAQQKILHLQDNRIKQNNPLHSELDDWIIELTAGTKLTENALFVVANSVVNEPQTKLIYSDHDHLLPSGEFCDPHMKPDWNPDLFDAMNYLEPLVACKKELWETQTNNDRHDLYKSLLETIDANQILHIPNVLVSVPVSGDGNHLEPNCRRITQTLPKPEPLVSVLIPTRDKGQMLKKCLESLFRKTVYPSFEVVLVDHETTERKAKKVIEEFSKKENFKVTQFSGSFNFSAMMNQGASMAEGDIFILLNNDIEIIESEWLNELVSQVARHEVGIVGALLLFKDGTIQHAGVHPGEGGMMGHGHKHLPGDSSGYFSRLKAVHEVAAVTGACMAVQKTTWRDLGGLDEKNLAVAYNDIDLCFKAREKGLRVILTPYAKMIHHESVSRGTDDDPVKNLRLQKELETILERWGEYVFLDPAYSQNLSFDGGSFELAVNPSYEKF